MKTICTISFSLSGFIYSKTHKAILVFFFLYCYLYNDFLPETIDIKLTSFGGSFVNTACMFVFFRLTEFKAALLAAFSSAHAQTLPLATVKASVKRDKPFSDEEIDSALQVMQDANQIMVADENVFLI